MGKTLLHKQHDNEATPSPTTKSQWSHLQIVLFSINLISNAAINLLHHNLITLYHEGIILPILRSLAHLHFVTLQFGVDGYPAWRETVRGIAKWMGERNGKEEGFADGVLKMLVGDGEGGEDDRLSKSRLLFQLTFARTVLRSLSPPVVRNVLLPQIIPHLTLAVPSAGVGRPTANEDRDLFEVAHATCISLLSLGWRFRSVVKEFAPRYADLVVQNFPAAIDFDLLRQSFSTSVKALSSLSSTQYSVVFSPAESGEEQESLAPEVTEEEDATEGFADGPDGDEGDFLAIKCIAGLVQTIYYGRVRVTKSGTNGPEGRLNEILSASPEVQQHMRKLQLCTALFDQIAHISLQSLHILLDGIKWVMLGGPTPTQWRDLLGSEAESAGGYFEGVAGGMNPDSSLVWKELLEVVFDGDTVDYTRRVACLEWYLEVASEGRERWENARRPSTSGNLKTGGHHIGEGVDGPQGTELRAKL
ncbi:hypothetical protein HDV00_010495 [Rhizophlyctis rosea]|nr:hypothetical protein HDV00_010495 [Rhizophlyctis rosea]